MQYQNYYGAVPHTTATLYMDSFLVSNNVTLPNVRFFYAQTDSGFYCTGMKISRTVLPLRFVNDSMVIEEQDILWSDRPQPRFPLYLGHDHMYFTNYAEIAAKLTVAPNIVDSSAILKIQIYGEHLIREYGDVIMPITHDTVAALGLVQNYTVYDSIYLNGVRVEESLRDSLGFINEY